MTEGPVIGIDLGTTTCCVAVARDGVATVIPNHGYLTTPSMVAFTASGKRVVGHTAKRQAITNPANTVIAMKRLIGRRWDAHEVTHTADAAAYKLVQNPEGDVGVQLRDKVYRLTELSAILLEDLRRSAEDHLGQPVTRAVITVPAYFNDQQRQATRDAGQIAGLEVLRILNEPTAAAIAYGATKKVAKTIVVYDFGGGTFDISIVRVGASGLYEVLGTGGDTFLGGEDIDRLIMDWLVTQFRAETGIDLRGDPPAMQRLKDAAETAKRELSAVDRYEINLPFLASKGGTGTHLTRTLLRAELETMVRPQVERTLELTREALTAARLDVSQIDDVLMVGGSSRIPLVHREVERFLGKKPCLGVNPDEAVAVGAALHGEAIVTVGKKIELRDVTSLGLGFRLPDNKWQVMIERNTRVPFERSYTVTTSRPDQRTIRFYVLQGIEKSADANEQLGEFRFTGFTPGPDVEVAVTFALDEQGLVRITARDVATGQVQSLEIAGAAGLGSEELVRLRLEALVDDVARMCDEVSAGGATGDFATVAVEDARDGIAQAQQAIAANDISAIKKHREKLSQRRQMLRQTLLVGRS